MKVKIFAPRTYALVFKTCPQLYFISYFYMSKVGRNILFHTLFRVLFFRWGWLFHTFFRPPWVRTCNISFWCYPVSLSVRQFLVLSLCWQSNGNGFVLSKWNLEHRPNSYILNACNRFSSELPKGAPHTPLPFYVFKKLTE